MVCVCVTNNCFETCEKCVCVCVFFGGTTFRMKLTINVPTYVASKIGSHVISCVFIPCWAGRKATKVLKFWQIHMARSNHLLKSGHHLVSKRQLINISMS